jgi:hypothetical protein
VDPTSSLFSWEANHEACKIVIVVVFCVFWAIVGSKEIFEALLFSSSFSSDDRI